MLKENKVACIESVTGDLFKPVLIYRENKHEKYEFESTMLLGDIDTNDHDKDIFDIRQDCFKQSLIYPNNINFETQVNSIYSIKTTNYFRFNMSDRQPMIDIC